MELSSLTAISPVDGRYRSKCNGLEKFFSEYGLMFYRIFVEVEYFIALAELPLPRLEGISKADLDSMLQIYKNFSVDDARRIKEIESVTNHDVKAVEYYIKEQLDPEKTHTLTPDEARRLAPFKEFIHFGLTSQDINNTAFPMMVLNAMKEEYIPAISALIDKIESLATQWADIPMLAHTHGQPASPTRLGKELEVFAYRLKEQVAQIANTPVTGKFGGATGNFNAHHAAYPDIDWAAFADRFLEDRLSLRREKFTTQISNYDYLAQLFDLLCRINTILVDLDRDMWMYISMNYFKQRIKAGEVGSSAMPHKVNPIDFENSEGNLGIANAVFTHLAQKLPVSRLQRDLTDSTVLRNVGVPFAHTLIAIASTAKGLDKLLLNRPALEADLEANWAVVAEGIQTILRREGYPNPYEALKQLTRTNEAINAATIAAFIDTLDVCDDVKAQLRALSPSTYTGL